MKLSPDERQFIRRALGLDRDRVARRSYYTARAGREIAIGDALVARGLAMRAKQAPTVQTVGFTITFKGFRAACERGETLADSEFNLMQWREALAR